MSVNGEDHYQEWRPSMEGGREVRVFPPQREMNPVLFGFLVLGSTFFLYQVVGGILTFLFFGTQVTPENVQGMRFMTMLSQYGFLLAPALLAVTLMRWDWRTSLRLRNPGIMPIVYVVLCVLGLQFALQGYIQVQEYVLKNYLLPESIEPLFRKLSELIEKIYKDLLNMRSPGEALFVWIVIAITPSLCEEVLFRGIVQSSFERGMRLRWAFILTGGIFALFHFNPMSFIPLTILGVFFSLIVWRGNSLYLSMIAHLTNNTIAIISLYFIGSETIIPDDTAKGFSLASSASLSISGLILFIISFFLFWTSARAKSSIEQHY